MAVPYHVKNFHIAETIDPDNIKRVRLDAHFINSNGQDISKDYWLVNDVREPTNTGIVNVIRDGFNYAIANNAKVKVSVDTDRTYLWFYLPSAKGEDLRQFTGGENK
ncbi:hypothetical protein V5H46_24660 [Klebsiella quasipneumoniae subsp. quasipneumoniae]|uniref:hypothetical protein n=1 Tax=Klebsiella quasipneumoniae TaxID=1463165 RepID=UPI002FCD7A6F